MNLDTTNKYRAFFLVLLAALLLLPPASLGDRYRKPTDGIAGESPKYPPSSYARHKLEIAAACREAIAELSPVKKTLLAVGAAGVVGSLYGLIRTITTELDRIEQEEKKRKKHTPPSE